MQFRVSCSLLVSEQLIKIPNATSWRPIWSKWFYNLPILILLTSFFSVENYVLLQFWRNPIRSYFSVCPLLNILIKVQFCVILQVVIFSEHHSWLDYQGKQAGKRMGRFSEKEQWVFPERTFHSTWSFVKFSLPALTSTSTISIAKANTSPLPRPTHSRLDFTISQLDWLEASWHSFWSWVLY